MLEAQIGESRDVAAQNVELRRRAIDASARATAQAERSLRRVSADLHDGPAQYVALAAMRLDSLVPATEAGRREATALGEALQTALGEIRALSRGLSLPDLDRLSLAEVARRAVAAHLRPAGPPVELTYRGPEDPEVDEMLADLPLPFPAGGALERLAPRGRGGRRRRGRRSATDRLTATVTDAGRGSTPPRSEPCPAAAGWVSPGLRDRAESLGGELRIDSAPGRGTRLILTLMLGKGDDAMTTAAAITMVLADDHPIFRDGLVRTLEESGAFSVLGAAGSADEAVALVERHGPDPRAPRHLDAGRRHRGGAAGARGFAGDARGDADGLGERRGRGRGAPRRRDRLRAEGHLGSGADRRPERHRPRRGARLAGAGRPHPRRLPVRRRGGPPAARSTR